MRRCATAHRNSVYFYSTHYRMEDKRVKNIHLEWIEKTSEQSGIRMIDSKKKIGQWIIIRKKKKKNSTRDENKIKSNEN